MNIYSALKFVQIDHAPVNHLQVVVTDQSGKPDAGMTDLINRLPQQDRHFR